MSKPDFSVSLVEVSDGKLIVNSAACEELDAIESKVAVVAISGLSQTGKSSLLNWLIGEHHYFQVACNSYGGCTQGINMWISKVNQTTPEGDEYRVILLDLEGVKLNDKGSQYIFPLGVLLSSCLIYNSKGNIDDQSISNLSFMADLAKYIRISADDEPDKDMVNFAKTFPKFLWTPRDVQPDLLPITQRNLSSNQIMEAMLTPAKGFDRPTFERNRIRNIITSFFTDRKCIFLKNPLQQREGLFESGFIPKTSLNTDFQECLDNFTLELYNNLKPKILYGRPLTGSTFVKLLNIYIRNINENEIPTVSTAWNEVCILESHSAIHIALKIYSKKMDDLCAVHTLPKDDKDLFLADEIARGEALLKFRSKCLGESSFAMVDTLVDSMCKHFRSYQDANVRSSQGSAEKVLVDLYEKTIRIKLLPEKPSSSSSTSPSTSKSNSSGSSSVYLTDIQALRNDWRAMTFQFHQTVKGPGKYIVLSEFVRETLLDTMSILFASMKEQYEDNATMAVGVTRKTFDELTDTLQSTTDELILVQQQLSESHLKNDNMRLKIDELQHKVKEKIYEKEVYESSRAASDLETSSMVQALEGALHSQTALCCVKDETITALKIDLNLSLGKLQTEINNSLNLKKDLESANATLINIEESHRKALAEKDEAINKARRDLDDKMWAAETEARQKEMELSSTSSEIIAFQSSQLTVYQKKIDELKALSQSDKNAWDVLIAEKDEQIKELKNALQEQETRHLAEISHSEETYNALCESHKVTMKSWEDEHREANETFQRCSSSLKEREEDILAQRVEIQKQAAMEKVLLEKIQELGATVSQLTIEKTRLQTTVESQGYTSQELCQVLDSLREELDTKTMTITQQLESIERLREETESQRGRLIVLETESNKRQGIIDTFEINIKELEVQNNNLDIKLKEQLNLNTEFNQIKNNLDVQISIHEQKNIENENLINEQSLLIIKLNNDIQEQIQKYDIDLKISNDATLAMQEKFNIQEALEKESQGLRDVLLQINQELTDNNNKINEENRHLKHTYGSMHENYEKARNELEEKLKHEEITVKTLADALYLKDSQFTTIENEFKEISEKFHTTQEQLSKYTKESQDTTTVQSVLENRIIEVEALLEVSKQREVELEEVINGLKEDKKKFLDEMQFVIASAKQAEDTVKQDLISANKIIEEKDIRIVELQDTLKPTNAALQDITGRLAESRVELESTQVEVTKLSQQLQDEISRYDILSNENSELKEKLSALECSSAVTQTELESERDALQLETASLRSKLHENIEKVKDLNMQVNTLQEAKMRIDADHERVSQDDAVLQRILNSTMTEKVNLETELVEIKEQTRVLKERLLASEDMTTEQKYTISQLEVSVEERNDKVREYRSAIDEHLAKIKEQELLLEHMDVLKKQVVELEETLLERTNALKRTNGDQADKILEQNIIIGNLEQKVSGLQKMIDEDEVARGRAEVDDKIQEIQELTNVYLKLKQRVSELEEEQIRKSFEIQELTKFNREKEAMVRDLTLQCDGLKNKEITDELQKSKSLNDSYKGELVVARERIQELETAFQATIEKMMKSSPK